MDTDTKSTPLMQHPQTIPRATNIPTPAVMVFLYMHTSDED
jgi:hypothetical protein